MRVVLVNKYAYVTGGADRHCLELARALRAHGHSVAFLSTASANNEETDGVFVRCGVTHATRESLRGTRAAGVALRALWNGEAAYGMKQLIDEFHPDVIHAHKLYPQLSVAPIVAAAGRVPVVQTLHDYELVSASATDSRGGRVDREEALRAYRFLNSATLPIRRGLHVRRVSQFITVSSFVADVYKQHGIDCAVLPNFVPATASRGTSLSFSEPAKLGIPKAAQVHKLHGL